MLRAGTRAGLPPLGPCLAPWRRASSSRPGRRAPAGDHPVRLPREYFRGLELLHHRPDQRGSEQTSALTGRDALLNGHHI